MHQSVSCDMFHDSDDTHLEFTGQDIDKIDTLLNNDFISIWDWFVYNNLTIDVVEYKTKSIIFGSTRKLKSLRELDIRRGDIKIKQHSEVTYLGCILESTLSGESMAI